MKVKVIHFFGIVVGIVAVVAAYFILNPFQPEATTKNLFYFICVLGIIASLLPFMFAFLNDQKGQREKEEKFLEFTRDLVEGVRSGTPINKAIINLQRRDYGTLSPHVQKLANQLYLGINLSNAFSTFAKDTGSKVISRAMVLISEAQRAGGKIETIIQAVSDSVNQIEDLRKKRKAAVSNLVVQGYIIFLVFIVIMLVLEYAILPLAVEFSQNKVEGLNNNGGGEVLTKEQFSTPLFVMLLVQALFAGLVVGKLSEGSIFSGIKHSFILLTLTLMIVTGTRAFLG